MGTTITRTPEEYVFETLDFEVHILDKHFSALNGRDIEFVVVHHMTVKGDGSGSALDACYQIWQNREASAHYGVDGKQICQFVWDKDFAWATANTYGNLHGISIEHANKTLSPYWEIDLETWMTGAKLAAYIHVVYNLGRPTSTGFGMGGTLRTHQSFYSTACPGPYFQKIWSQYVAEVQRIYDLIKSGAVVTPTPTPQPVPVPVPLWGKSETWVLGATGPDALKMGQLINVWNKALGLPTWEPDSTFSSTEVKALSYLQANVWGFGNTAADLAKGGNSDGYPGLQSFDMLLKTPTAPTPEVPVTRLSLLHWNVAGSDTTNGFGARNATRGDEVGRHARSLGFDVLLTCEAGQDNLRNGISVGLGSVIGATEWEARAKAIWFTPDDVKNFWARKAYADNLFAYLNTLKWGAAFFGIKGGIKFSALEIHTDYRAPAKQAKQVQSIFNKWRVDTDKLGIKHVNTFVLMDGNWDGTSGDNPFHALDAYNFEEKGSRTEATFMGRKHLDGVLAHKLAKVSVDVKPRYDKNNIWLSDHCPVKATIELQ